MNENNKELHSIIFSGGEKGGVGKSFLIKVMVDYFIHKGWQNDFLLVDADPSINDVYSIFKNQSCEKVIFSDNKFNNQEPNLILDKVVEKTVVVNLPSNISSKFDDWVERLNLLAPDLKQYYQQIIYFFVSDGCYRSIERFIAQLNKYEKNLPHCLVLNPGRLTCGGNFRYLENYIPLMKTIKKYEVPVILLPELPANLQFCCDEKDVAYRELLNQSYAKISDKQNIKDFLTKVDNSFNTIFPNKVASPEGLIQIVKDQKKSRDEEKFIYYK